MPSNTTQQLCHGFDYNKVIIFPFKVETVKKICCMFYWGYRAVIIYSLNNKQQNDHLPLQIVRNSLKERNKGRAEIMLRLIGVYRLYNRMSWLNSVEVSRNSIQNINFCSFVEKILVSTSKNHQIKQRELKRKNCGVEVSFEEFRLYVDNYQMILHTITNQGFVLFRDTSTNSQDRSGFFYLY